MREQMQLLVINYLQENGLGLLYKVLGAFAVFLVGLLIIKSIVKKVKIKVLQQSLTEDEYTQKMAQMLGNIVFVSLMVFNILIIFSFLGFEVALIMGSLSIAIGFAMENTIKNMISGILFLTNKKNKLGDTVEVLGDYQFRGTIEEITLRHTVFRTIENQRIIIPNGALSETPIKTFKNEALIRGCLELKVPRYVNITQVKNIILQTINQHANVIHKEYSTIIVSGFDSHGIGLKGFYYLSPQMGKTDFVINSEVRIMLNKIFKKYGIAAPYLNISVDVER